MIEQLESDKFELTAQLKKSDDYAIRATELQVLAEEAARLNITIQAAEMEKQMLQQEVQKLTDAIESLRTTVLESTDAYLNQFRLDLNRSFSL